MVADGWHFWLNRWQKEPLLALASIAITFLVPWLAMSMGRKSLLRRERELMAAFPDMNPDMVLKLSISGAVTYYNSAVMQYLQKLGISNDDS
ncbi:MAG: hypothetical protein GY820_31090 [Gammaproteobacteria bacterium]|nr:hypothetical protein [Gammaproteobacteria bacterium]